MFVQAIQQQPPNKEFVKFCNSLRCPLCDSQLDGNIHPQKSNLYCVNNNDEYKCIWQYGAVVPDFEKIVFWYPQYMYEISIHHKGINTFVTKIERFNLDVHPRFRYTTRKLVFDFSGDRILFFRKRMEEDVFLKKLSLYNVFS